MKANKEYSMCENIKYMLSNWALWNKKGFVYLLIRVPAMIVVPMLIAYVPKLMIDNIEKQVLIKEMILNVAFVSLIIAGASWVSPFMQQKLIGSAQIIRMHYAILSFRKTMTNDFVDVESLEGRERLERSKNFTNGYYSGAQDFCDVVCQMLSGIIGVISSVLLLYKLPIVMILIIILSCVIEFVLYRVDYKYDRANREKRSKFRVEFDYFYRLGHEYNAGKDIRLYRLNDWFIKIVADLIKDFSKLIQKYLKVSFTITSLRALLYMCRDGVAYLCLISSVIKKEISVSDFIFYFGIVTGFSGYISLVTFEYNQLIRCSLECSKFREYIDTPEKFSNEKEDIGIGERYVIEFKDVSFKYKGAKDDTIKGMSFVAQPGENIAIVGENGAGKTTAIKLLSGLYSVTGGEILINGENIEDFSRKSYFALFSVVFQDYHFLPLSIEQNITLCEDDKVDKERFWSVLSLSGIKDKIESLKDKEKSMMNKMVYKDATDFSGGEKQKILLARALYKNAPILILDEPTAALDSIAENELYLQYSEFSKNKTSFFISHRLSSTRFCDRILFMSDGKIVEEGTHDELMKKKGKYYQMFELQSYYYKESVNEL